ncbi:MAG: cell division protein FtsL [Acidiferrobacterales bacterium]|nr:cell division protein FtsL [Acidiferrobacterales bacterium]
MTKLQLFMLSLVLISAAAVVAVRHQNRLAFVALQKEEQKRVDLQAEWGRLMLEKATWTRQHNVADTAKKQLSMLPPSPDKIVTLDLASDRKVEAQ